MYTVIARKYRPQTFGEVVDQEHIKQTLRNAIEQHRIAHGYIFSGQRGTGKTTMARLLAKALNCERGPAATLAGTRQGAGESGAGSWEPCGECASCREITASNSVDVIEIDAASNRGIDEIRALRENVRYAPARDRYKIYIVDEAHQITRDAWNALLKTLEEPPSNVLFIFCTTASHSIPATIVSRCQSFRFHNLGFEQTVAQLRHIAKEEGIEATDEALAVIAASGEGSLRDSLSALDQAIACCGRVLDGALVRSLLGVVAAEVLDEVVAAVIAGSSDRMLEVVDRLVREGHDLRNFARELVRRFRNLLVLKSAGAQSGLVEASAEERERLAAMVESFSEDDLTRLLQLTLSLYSDLHHSPAPRFHAELGLLKLVHARRLVAIEELISQSGEGPGSGPARGGPGGGSSGGRGSGGPSPFESDTARKRSQPPAPSSGGTAFATAPSSGGTAFATAPSSGGTAFATAPSSGETAFATAGSAPQASAPPASPATGPPSGASEASGAQPSAAAAPAPAMAAASAPSGASPGALAQQVLARLEDMSRKMLAFNLEGASAWDVTEDRVTICFPPGNTLFRMISADDQQAVRAICSELLGRPIALRLGVQESVGGNGQSPAPTSANGQPGGSEPAAGNGGQILDDPQLASFLRLGDVVAVQKLR